MHLDFSFIIPVYNRPQEIEELLVSMTKLKFEEAFEIVIIEDGSTISSKSIIKKYEQDLSISYYEKSNSGPGDSRNYGMIRAKGNYFLILDSDVILPEDYLNNVSKGLNERYTDCFGGPDGAHQSFTPIQKGINYAMTSILTTGGIRGGKTSTTRFEPRSFNMGLSKKAFEATQGFGKIHPGEDPDLSIRLGILGYETQLIEEALVFHKRRIDWSKFYKQVNKFGKVRPILTRWHPQSAKITYWFPSVFCFGLALALVCVVFGRYEFLFCYVLYTLLILIHSAIKNKSLKIAVLSILAVYIQFIGYGLGFARSTYYIRILGRKPEQQFPKLFFS